MQVGVGSQVVVGLGAVGFGVDTGLAVVFEVADLEVEGFRLVDIRVFTFVVDDVIAFSVDVDCVEVTGDAVVDSPE